MKTLQIESSGGKGFYGSVIKKQAEISRAGRGTFSRAGGRRNAARWTHVRYKGSLALKPAADAVEVEIRSPDRGDEARLLSSFLGWLDRHFGEQLASVNIRYGRASGPRRGRPQP